MFLRSVLYLFILTTAVSLTVYNFWYEPKFKAAKQSHYTVIKKSSEDFARLKVKATSIKTYISENHYNSNICFLIDMKIASGKKRFFVYDLENDSILTSGLVAHGSCNKGFQIQATFSNKIGSNCSCSGKFRVGKSYNGRFGLAYKLYGLDSCNNNAFERTIVLHSYKCVPEQETYPIPICNSRGCPMVSAGFLQKLKSYLDNSDKPLLLNIFY